MYKRQLLEGIKAAGTTDRKAVMEAVKGLKDLKVPVGVITCDENNDLVHNINAVSYTHLDVYKRQTSSSAEWAMRE